MNSLHQNILQRSRQVLANLPSVQAVGRLTVAQGVVGRSHRVCWPVGPVNAVFFHAVS